MGLQTCAAGKKLCGCQLGFTLAEVLITLGIIGIVAAMTMPALMNKYKGKELCTKTRKLYSNIQNAVLLAQNDAGVVGDTTVLFDTSKTSAEVAKNFSKYFNGAKVCENKSQAGCAQYYYSQKYATKYSGSGTSVLAANHTYPKIILNDGAVIAIDQRTACNRTEYTCEMDADGNCILDEDGNTTTVPSVQPSCAYLYIDVNGAKNPNQFGADSYQIAVLSTKLSPATWAPWGAASLKNILMGKDELDYANYTVGEER